MTNKNTALKIASFAAFVTSTGVATDGAKEASAANAALAAAFQYMGTYTIAPGGEGGIGAAAQSGVGVFVKGMSQPNTHGTVKAVLDIIGYGANAVQTASKSILLGPGDTTTIAAGKEQWMIRVSQSFAGLQHQWATIDWYRQPYDIAQALLQRLHTAMTLEFVGILGAVVFAGIFVYTNMGPETKKSLVSMKNNVLNSLRKAPTRFLRTQNQQDN